MIRQFFVFACCSLIFSSCSVSKHQQKGPEKKAEVSPSASLQGTWILDYVLGPADLTVLYPGNKPELVISSTADGTFQGSSGCNRISGKIKVEDRKMTFTDPVALTRMMCPGEGENAFLAGLKRINHYAVSPAGDELTCIQGDIVIMRFHKK